MNNRLKSLKLAVLAIIALGAIVPLLISQMPIPTAVAYAGESVGTGNSVGQDFQHGSACLKSIKGEETEGS